MAWAALGCCCCSSAETVSRWARRRRACDCAPLDQSHGAGACFCRSGAADLLQRAVGLGVFLAGRCPVSARHGHGGTPGMCWAPLASHHPSADGEVRFFFGL